MPFYLSGEVQDYHQLAHRTHEELTQAGIDLLLNHTATAIDPIEHRVTVKDWAAHVDQLSYDRLIIATGAQSKRPHISGLDLSGVFLLHTMQDSFQMQDYLSTHTAHSAVIVGGGYIGLEMADALTLRGLSVTLIEHGPSVLKTVDPSLGARVQVELERHGVVAQTGIQIHQIEQREAQLCEMTVEAFSALDLSYTPPLGSPWDLVQMCAQDWSRAARKT